mmetsp:Transcript_22078/g.42914  ORF Transcript_22078/g.42914 Transcript_22078/m.42914 type:complete len:433 (-) Transcript_22078:59-1357(-)
MDFSRSPCRKNSARHRSVQAMARSRGLAGFEMSQMCITACIMMSVESCHSSTLWPFFSIRFWKSFINTKCFDMSVASTTAIMMRLISAVCAASNPARMLMSLFLCMCVNTVMIWWFSWIETSLCVSARSVLAFLWKLLFMPSCPKSWTITATRRANISSSERYFSTPALVSMKKTAWRTSLACVRLWYSVSLYCDCTNRSHFCMAWGSTLRFVMSCQYCMKCHPSTCSSRWCEAFLSAKMSQFHSPTPFRQSIIAFCSLSGHSNGSAASSAERVPMIFASFFPATRPRPTFFIFARMSCRSVVEECARRVKSARSHSLTSSSSSSLVSPFVLSAVCCNPLGTAAESVGSSVRIETAKLIVAMSGAERLRSCDSTKCLRSSAAFSAGERWSWICVESIAAALAPIFVSWIRCSLGVSFGSLPMEFFLIQPARI